MASYSSDGVCTYTTLAQNGRRRTNNDERFNFQRSEFRSWNNRFGEKRGRESSDEHQPSSPDKQTTGRTTFKIFNLQMDLLYKLEVDDPEGTARNSNPTGSPSSEFTERQRRFLALSMLSSAISFSELAAPGNKVLCATTTLREWPNEVGESIEPPPITFSVTVTFDKNGMPAKVELADQNEPVDISELPQISMQ